MPKNILLSNIIMILLFSFKYRYRTSFHYCQNKNIMLGKFTTGLLTGLTLGLLFAPQKGRKTRRQVMEAAESWKHSLDNLFGKGENELDAIKEMLESDADLLNPEIRHKLLKLIEQNKKTIQEAKQQTLS